MEEQPSSGLPTASAVAAAGCHTCPELEAPSAAAGVSAATSSGAGCQDSLTCAICLEQMLPCNIACLPECGHQYCVNCILFWATRKDKAWCPQCRMEFSQLQLYRKLNGELRDEPGLESLCLLKRCAWFQDYAQAREQGRNPAVPRLLSEHDAVSAQSAAIEDVLEYQDYDRYFDDFDQDEEVEAYYRSSAAGSARITLGNRRWGENGYVAAGRMRARPVQPVPSKAQKGKAASKAAAKTAAKQATSSAPAAAASTSAPVPVPGKGKAKARASIPGADWEDDVAGTSPGGRRARRNARRAALDENASGSAC